MNIVGLGGTLRPGSSSEQACALALAHAAALGAHTRLFTGHDLSLPAYDPQNDARMPSGAQDLIEALRCADAVVLAAPCYHGAVSGLLKNAIDYIEAMRSDERVYLEGRAVACIACGSGWQGPNTVLGSLRSIVHSLRGWPTPLGVAVNTAVVRFADGQCSDAAIAGQIETMMTQVVAFAAMQDARPPANPAKTRLSLAEITGNTRAAPQASAASR